MKNFKFKDLNGNEVVLNERESKICSSMQDKFNEAIYMNDVTGLGAQIDINTLTVLLKTISQQKFFEIDIERYMNIDVDGGWADQALQVREFLLNDPMSGFEDQANHGAKISISDTAVQGAYIKALTWIKQIKLNIAEINQAALLGNFSLITAKERARKKAHDLDMQQLAFLGYSDKVKGLLNQHDIVTVDTTTISKPVSTMDFNEINDFAGALIEEFRKTSDRTAYPNRLIFPESDYNGMGRQVSPQYPVKNKIQLLKEAIEAVTTKPVELLPCAYSDAAHNNLGVNRYALYNRDFDTLRLQKAIDYTPTMMNNIDGWNIVNTAFARTFGVFINRPKEIMYFDN